MRHIVFHAVIAFYVTLVVLSPKTAARMARRILPAKETIAIPQPKPKQHILMVRDVLSLVEEAWCSFDSQEELAAARDGLNQVYDGSKSFWGKDDEPPNFARDMDKMKAYRLNWRS